MLKEPVAEADIVYEMIYSWDSVQTLRETLEALFPSAQVPQGMWTYRSTPDIFNNPALPLRKNLDLLDLGVAQVANAEKGKATELIRNLHQLYFETARAISLLRLQAERIFKRPSGSTLNQLPAIPRHLPRSIRDLTSEEFEDLKSLVMSGRLMIGHADELRFLFSQDGRRVKVINETANEKFRNSDSVETDDYTLLIEKKLGLEEAGRLVAELFELSRVNSNLIFRPPAAYFEGDDLILPFRDKISAEGKMSRRDFTRESDASRVYSVEQRGEQFFVRVQFKKIQPSLVDPQLLKMILKYICGLSIQESLAISSILGEKRDLKGFFSSLKGIQFTCRLGLADLRNYPYDKLRELEGRVELNKQAFCYNVGYFIRIQGHMDHPLASKFQDDFYYLL